MQEKTRSRVAHSYVPAARHRRASEPPYYYGATGGTGMKYMAAGNTGTGTYILPYYATE